MKKLIIVFQPLLMLFWAAQLIKSDCDISSTLLLLLFLSGVCFCSNLKHDVLESVDKNDDRTSKLILAFSVLLSCLVSFSNYEVWAFPNVPEENGGVFLLCYKAINAIVIFGGGFCVFYNILTSLVTNIELIIWRKKDKISNYVIAFFSCFFILVLTRWIVLYYCQYPGILDPDSIDQMNQIMTDKYSNHHPFYYTVVIKTVVSIGLFLFNDINAAVALFSLFQLIFMAACFSYVSSTLIHIGAPDWITIGSMLLYLLLPQHIVFAISMDKDAPFGAFVLLFLVSFYRYVSQIGKNFINYIIMMIASIGICLFRSNGFFAFTFIVISFGIMWWGKYKKILISFAVMIFVSFILKHNVLSALNVVQPDTIESLSIPVQQVTRVVYEGYDISEEQRQLIDDIIDIDLIPQYYHAYESDPMKELVREKGNQHLITEKAGDYLKLWGSLGMRYPLLYIRSWIDETRGYWNAMYGQQYYQTGARINDIGIHTVIRSVPLYTIFYEYIWMFKDMNSLHLFIGIGFSTWIDLVLLMVAIYRKDKISMFISLPLLYLVMTFIIATPHYSLFRYMYFAHCILPFVAAIVFRPINNEMENNHIE